MVVVLLIIMVSKNGNESNIHNTYSNDNNNRSRSSISLYGVIQSGSLQEQAAYRAVQRIVRGFKRCTFHNQEKLDLRFHLYPRGKL
jgi:hypothetical protein